MNQYRANEVCTPCAIKESTIQQLRLDLSQKEKQQQQTITQDTALLIEARKATALERIAAALEMLARR